MEPVMKIFLVFVLVFISILIPLVTLVVGINIGREMNNKPHRPDPRKVIIVHLIGTVLTLTSIYLAIWTFHL